MEGELPEGEVLAAISDGLAQLHTRFYGRGPAKVKTYALEDLVICVLWDGFTRVERTLLTGGESDAVKGFRHTFQATMEGLFKRVVEDATDRPVSAYMNQIHTEPDVAVEMFLLGAAG